MGNSEVNREAAAVGVEQTARLVKTRERLEISSGYGLIIDQFMLGNDQFLSSIGSDLNDIGAAKDQVCQAAEKYGGYLVDLPPGSYCVVREPEENLIAVCPQDICTQENSDDQSKSSSNGSEVSAEFSFDISPLLEGRGNLKPLRQVFVDTRCLVLVDAKVLSDTECLSRYAELRGGGEDKGARDLIRSYGGAVRYGFNRYGDELGLFKLSDPDIIALWPDVID